MGQHYLCPLLAPQSAPGLKGMDINPLLPEPGAPTVDAVIKQVARAP